MPLFCGTVELKAGQSFVDSILPCVYTCFSFRIIVLNKRGSGQTSLLKYSGIIMDEKTLLFILLGVVVLLFAICLVGGLSSIVQTNRELSGKPGVFKGPGGEPRWNGVLPVKVDDYAEPRYVYENLAESTDYLPENGRVIGYRISPDLVIHSRVMNDVNPPALLRYIQRLGGKLLEADDALILQDNWQAVSALRVRSGDQPLKHGKFWFRSKEGYPVCAEICADGVMQRDVIGFSGFYAPLILKR